MPPTLSFADLRERRVGVWGIGTEGAATVARLAALGVEPVLVDDRAGTPGPGGRPVLPTGDGGLAALRRCDVVVKSPGVSRYRADVRGLVDGGVPVLGGLGLWLAGVDRDRVLCVTGTKGKSTTTAVAAHLIERLGHRCLLGGNIGRPPWDPAYDDQQPDYWVIETSSYQATDMPLAPPVVAVTSLHPDHLDWHGDVETYYRDKLSICTRPGARLTVANGDSEPLRQRAGLLGPHVQWVHADPAPWAAGLGLLGVHNRRNALIARACLVAMGVPGADDDGAIAAAAEGFRGLDSRLRLLGDVDGVTFVDDSLSTNVLPTLAALDAFPGRRVALLVGGFDRGIDYAPLGAGLRERGAPTLVLTLPASGPRIRAAVEAAGPGPLVAAEDCPSLESAVTRGRAWAAPDGVVLLSPAAPSFGAFRDYRDRAAAFRRAMLDCRAD